MCQEHQPKTEETDIETEMCTQLELRCDYCKASSTHDRMTGLFYTGKKLQYLIGKITSLRKIVAFV